MSQRILFSVLNGEPFAKLEDTSASLGFLIGKLNGTTASTYLNIGTQTRVARATLNRELGTATFVGLKGNVLVFNGNECPEVVAHYQNEGGWRFVRLSDGRPEQQKLDEPTKLEPKVPVPTLPGIRPLLGPVPVLTTRPAAIAQSPQPVRVAVERRTPPPVTLSRFTSPTQTVPAVVVSAVVPKAPPRSTGHSICVRVNGNSIPIASAQIAGRHLEQGLSDFLKHTPGPEAREFKLDGIPLLVVTIARDEQGDYWILRPLEGNVLRLGNQPVKALRIRINAAGRVKKENDLMALTA